MSNAEPGRKRTDEEEISTADLVETGTTSTDDPQANRARREGVIDVEPEERDVRPVQVQKTEVAAQTVAPAPDSSNRTSNQPDETERKGLFPSGEVTNFRARWEAIQVGFVDEPRRCVQEADSLLAATIKRLAEQFATERSDLEGQWDRGGDVSTEQLRIALRHYRSFFGRLLAI
jgi:hypothetical protein